MPLAPYYQDQENGIVIYHGDARKILPRIKHADLVLTDPPYGVGLAGKRTKSRTSSRNRGYETKEFEDTAEYVRGVLVPLVKYCIVKFGRAIVTPGTRCLSAYPKPRDMDCIFNPAGTGRSPWGFQCAHPVLYYGACPSRGGGSSPNGFLDRGGPDSACSLAYIEGGHPCPKPLRWMLWLVAKGSLPGETVLDPFAGSGTTLVAAKILGRKAIGIDIEKRYCQIAVDRLQNTQRPLIAAEPRRKQQRLI